MFPLRTRRQFVRSLPSHLSGKPESPVVLEIKEQHCWRPDMPLPYSIVATWKHLHQEQTTRNVVSIVCTSWNHRPRNAPGALERLHCLLHTLAPEDAHHPAECKSSKVVRFLRGASLFDPQGSMRDLGRYVGLQFSLEYCPAGANT